jgi:drug/metabolite transporter (DMT)-like permease
VSTTAFLLVLGSAVCHATWNLLAKRSVHKTAFLWGAMLAAFVLFLAPALFYAVRDGIPPRGWLFGAGTALLHGVYTLSLARGYQLGDLSTVYPTSRGMGPMLVPILAVLILGETVSAPAAAGMALVVLGIYTVHAQALAPRAMLRSLRLWERVDSRWAALTGVLIAFYSLWDKAALDYLPPVALLQFVMAGPILLLARAALRDGGRPARTEWRERRRSVVAAGILAPLGYMLVLVALTTSRVSYVAPAREVGILLGVAMGVVLLGESYGVPRIVGSLLMAAGVVVLGLAP